MHTSPNRTHTLARASGLLATAFFTLGAQAAVTTYTSSASFLADTTTANLATFEGLAPGSYGATLTTSGITITSLPGSYASHDVYILPAGSSLLPVADPSQALSGNGDENFRFQLAGAGTFTAIGFDFYSNRSGGQVFALYDAGSALIASIRVPQALSSVGFIGFTSTTPIATFTTTIDAGSVTNAGYDNLRIGGVSAVPEPSAGWLLLAGLAAVTGLVRRRTT